MAAPVMHNETGFEGIVTHTRVKDMVLQYHVIWEDNSRSWVNATDVTIMVRARF